MKISERYTALLEDNRIYIKDNQTDCLIFVTPYERYDIGELIKIMTYFENEFNREYDLYVIEIFDYCTS